MKTTHLIIAVLINLAFYVSAWGNCPQDIRDRGICDTMYVEPWSVDVADSVWSRPGPYFVRIPIYVTADIVDQCDSINGFVIPLCYTHSNPSKYCSLSSYWNRTLWTPSNLPRSIFRHLITPTNDTIHNWMMDLYNAENGQEWNTIILDLDGTSHYWLVMIPTGPEDTRFKGGSKVLLVTMTFKLQDTTQICMDTCFWPPYNRLGFSVPETSSVYVCGVSNCKIPLLGSPYDTASYKMCFDMSHFVNHPPNAFSLLLPNNNAITPPMVHFDWQNATDPDSGDSVKYDLHVSSFFKFLPESTTIDSNITQSEFTKVLTPKTYYWKVKAKDSHGGVTWSNEIRHFRVQSADTLPGDFNRDKFIDIGDVVYGVNYLFKSGPAPDPKEAGDSNCDKTVTVADLVFLINYLFKGGPAPDCQY
jgi:hypothetical protein